MADTVGSALPLRGTPDRTNDYFYVWNGGNSYRSTINNELGITGAPVGTTDSQTLTNKTLTAPTVSSPVLSGTITGTYTLAGTPTFPASVVTLAGTQTLTNKTLTSPTITTPTLTNASITQDAVVGFTTANTGTVYGVPITAGLIAGSSVTNIPAASLSASAITLGYAQITANFSTTSATDVQVTGLSVTCTIPTGGRRIKITFMGRSVTRASTFTGITIWDGTVGSGTKIGAGYVLDGEHATTVIGTATPAAGSKTYNIGLVAGGGGTATVSATATGEPSWVLVEAI